jgi:hypothetical protein
MLIIHKVEKQRQREPEKLTRKKTTEKISGQELGSTRKRTINVAIPSDKQTEVTSRRRRKVDPSKSKKGVGEPEQRELERTLIECDEEGEVRNCNTRRPTRQ